MKLTIYCQNTAQAGDRYGVAISMILNPLSILILFVHSSEEGIKRADKWLDLYKSFGLKMERIKIICICSFGHQEISVLGDKFFSSKTEYDKFLSNYPELEKKIANLEIKIAKGSKNSEPIFANIAYKAMTEPKIAMKAHTALKPEIEKLFLDSQLVNGNFKSNQEILIVEKIKQILDPEGTEIPSTIKIEGIEYAPVTDTTRFISDFIKKYTYNIFIEKITTHYRTKCFVNIEAEQQNIIDNFCNDIIDNAEKEKSKIVNLIWIRGVNQSEFNNLLKDTDSLEALKEKSKPIWGELETRIAKNKRNPQHVMTLKLFTLLKLAPKLTNEKVLSLPIGDPVRIDEYDYFKDNNTIIRKTDLYPYDDKNKILINFFHRNGFQSEINQLYFLFKMHDLAKSRNIKVIQVGLRSGGLERGSYLGIPTIYLEEVGASSAGRLGGLSHYGNIVKEIDFILSDIFKNFEDLYKLIIKEFDAISSQLKIVSNMVKDSDSVNKFIEKINSLKFFPGRLLIPIYADVIYDIIEFISDAFSDIEKSINNALKLKDDYKNNLKNSILESKNSLNKLNNISISVLFTIHISTNLESLLSKESINIREIEKIKKSLIEQQNYLASLNIEKKKSNEILMQIDPKLEEFLKKRKYEEINELVELKDLFPVSKRRSELSENHINIKLSDNEYQKFLETRKTELQDELKKLGTFEKSSNELRKLNFSFESLYRRINISHPLYKRIKFSNRLLGLYQDNKDFSEEKLISRFINNAEPEKSDDPMTYKEFQNLIDTYKYFLRVNM
ncbi:hypothetical protein ACWNT8_10400 [Pigmentibacter ruber]